VGVKEGAKLVVGGKRHGDKGYFVQPTIFTDVTDDMTIAKEEIFGPVMSVLTYKTVDEVRLHAPSHPCSYIHGLVITFYNMCRR
jgi:acyl-CoA reductase-like NAD-dependent aldehyde dehydrogenase